MKVLVVGRGGREHALCEKLKSSPLVREVYVAPGNPGMAGVALLLPHDEEDQERLVRFAQEQKIDLVVIGPEKPLVEGLADRFREAGIKVFAPSQSAAEIEGSKCFAKELMEKYDIPTADYRAFSEYFEAKTYLDRCSMPIVIKADGLAAGKGVVVAQSRSEAETALETMLMGKKFGEASSTVIIEEFLEGEEFSLMALVHGDVVIPLEVARDHKRAYDGDRGPNTGGMGAYCPIPQVTSEVVETAVKTILKPTASAMVQEGRPFTGVLYAGLMLTEKGPRVIEFNARFGDPETQVVLPRLESDLVEAILKLMDGQQPELKWSLKSMVGVVVASQGYPGPCLQGTVLPPCKSGHDLRIYYSGVVEDQPGQLTSAGGRVFLVGALGNSIPEAQDKAYEFLANHSKPGFFYRKDIANLVKAKAVSR